MIMVSFYFFLSLKINLSNDLFIFKQKIDINEQVYTRQYTRL